MTAGRRHPGAGAPLQARADPRMSARITAAFELAGVRAGSALLRLGERLLAIQDDAYAAVWIDPATRMLAPQVLHGDGLPLAKKLKPDFEAAFTDADGTAYLFGSGSSPARCRIAVLGPDADVRWIDGAALYEALAGAIGGPPNIEGVVASGDRLRFFHRGPGRSEAPSRTVDLNRDVLAGAPARVFAMHEWDLGRVAGLALGFTDATGLGDGSMLYLAVAEDTPDGIADGPIAGSVVGRIDGNSARWTPLLDMDGRISRRKVEGLALDAGARAGWLLTDPDDPAVAAQLCRFEWNAGR